MTDEDEGPHELLLAGYVPVFAEGFALPCYAARPQANTWYVAICSVDGDHAGTITGFEIFDADSVQPLPEELQLRISIGSNWQDVFLWSGELHVGVPAAILRELDAEVRAVAAEAPISLLDLALAAGNVDARPFVKDAFEHISRRHGKEMADTWFRDMLVREQARLIARKHLVARGLAEKLASDVHQIVVHELAGRLQLVLPRSIASALDSASDLGTLEDRIHILGDAVEIGIDIHLGDDAAKVDAPKSAATPTEIEAEEPFHTARDILIIVSGERARAIARHLAAPDWLPTPDGASSLPRYLLRRDTEAGRDRGGAAVGRAVIDVVGDRMLPPELDVYGVVVWLVDDKALLHDRADPLLYELGDPARARSDTVLLVAPALPVLEPSRILSGTERRSPLDLPFGCVIDTSLARSPFWTGNPRRATDRRIGDIIIGSAMICAMDERLREELTHAGPKYDLRLLSFALEPDGPGESDIELGLLSESSSTGFKRPHRLGPKESFSRFEVRPFIKSADRVRSGYYSLRRHAPDFEDFVQIVIASLREPKFIDLTRSGAPVHRSELLDARSRAQFGRELPAEVEQELAHPHLAVAVRDFGSASDERIIVTAEAPSVAAVRAAFYAGWALARYTDRETIWEVLDAKPWNRRSPLPGEIRLPQLRRLTRNRGLVVRGVDPRDVVRLPLATFESWRSKAGESPLLAEARGYRASIDDETVTEIAIPVSAIEQALRSEDPAVRALEHILKEDFFAFSGRPRKRPGDLRAAWTAPSKGGMRFVLEDGRLPVSLRELTPDVVPAQRLFIVDGDGSVPALFTSRLFNVWAHATLSRSTSWSSRFSVSNTFETLPIPGEFVVLHEEAQVAQLRLARHAGSLKSLVKELERDPRILGGQLRTENANNGSGVWVGHPLLAEINAALLSAIDLSPDATDLDILDRLLTINQES